ncbi:hypothetical protein CC78DRAFT_152761 [Lojkania enalia]|uniref:F-box domain-containing protein n=1 Tax=Lojkania enalia TaxID=147567 RepID=A0A9P4KEL4_9PLEO|nr:hypothetical protein CC78DRAFT_152761 [Didymosphaeria enalia]
MAFLKLPGELRNKIYAYLLFPSQEKLLIAFANKYRALAESCFQSPVFRLNRQIRAEAIAFLCANKQIHFQNAISALNFLRLVGEGGISNFKRISLTIDVFQSQLFLETGQYEFLQLLRKARNLKHFHLQVDVWKWGYGDEEPEAFASKAMDFVDSLEGGKLTWAVAPREGITAPISLVFGLRSILGEENMLRKRRNYHVED